MQKKTLTLELEGRKLRYILKLVDMMDAAELEEIDEEDLMDMDKLTFSRNPERQTAVSRVVRQIENLIDEFPLY